jgi:HEPN domain-containing protein
MNELTREWIRKAEADLAVVREIAHSKPPLHDAVCFHCQQGAQKFLKGLMQEIGVAIPRTHDLAHLVFLLKPHRPTLRPLREAWRL